MTQDDSLPSELEVVGYFQQLSNWGRWGDEDRLGTVNHITAQVSADAAKLIQTGTVVSCARAIETGWSQEDAPGAPSPQRFMLRTGEGLRDPERATPQGFAPGARLAAAAEYVGYAAHGYRITHLDALSHAFWDYRMYNAIPAERVNASGGANDHGIANFAGGIATRGILIDAARHRGVDWMSAGEGVSGAELSSIVAAEGIEVRTGDALLLRTGYGLKRLQLAPDSPDQGSAGWDASCLPLFRDWGVSLIAADTAQDVRPSSYKSCRSPIHAVGLVAMGMPMIDNADLERLARTCRDLRRCEFFFTVAPLALAGATSSAVNPLAVF